MKESEELVLQGDVDVQATDLGIQVIIPQCTDEKY